MIMLYKANPIDDKICYISFIIYMDLLNINIKQIQVYTTHLLLFGDLGIQGWFMVGFAT